MSVDAIGTVLNQSDSSVTSKNTINQNEFIKLFLAQLQFQDPMEPVDNREFLAQLAQFSNLQQSTQISQNTEGALRMDSSAAALSLLGKTVDAGTLGTGEVTAVSFTQSGPLLTLKTSDDQVITSVLLAQIEQVVSP
jgi:flagellar basal-body rod modification protein FlgD